MICHLFDLLYEEVVHVHKSLDRTAQQLVDMNNGRKELKSEHSWMSECIE